MYLLLCVCCRGPRCSGPGAWAAPWGPHTSVPVPCSLPLCSPVHAWPQSSGTGSSNPDPPPCPCPACRKTQGGGGVRGVAASCPRGFYGILEDQLYVISACPFLVSLPLEAPRPPPCSLSGGRSQAGKQAGVVGLGTERGHMRAPSRAGPGRPVSQERNHQVCVFYSTFFHLFERQEERESFRSSCPQVAGPGC